MPVGRGDDAKKPSNVCLGVMLSRKNKIAKSEEQSLSTVAATALATGLCDPFVLLRCRSKSRSESTLAASHNLPGVQRLNQRLIHG